MTRDSDEVGAHHLGGSNVQRNDLPLSVTGRVASIGGSRARFIGTQGDASVAWAVDRNVSLNVAYSILLPGQFITDTGPVKTVHFVGSQVVFRF